MMEGSILYQKAWERRLRSYEQAYFDALRSLVARYGMIPDAFPDKVRLRTRSIAAYRRDGIVLARYQADEDNFLFEVSLNETIYDAARRIGGVDNLKPGR